MCGKGKQGTLACLASVGIILLVFLNIVFLSVGIGALVAGKKLDAEVDKHHYISDLLDLVEFDNYSLRDLEYRLVTSVQVLGACSIATSVMGAVAVVLTTRTLLIMYVVAVTLCILVQLVLISFWIALITDLNQDLMGHFKSLLRQYSFSIDTYSLGWDYVFIYYECCGVEPVTSSHNDFQAIPSYWWNNWLRGSNVIPNSCCKGVSIYTYLFYFNNDCTKDLNKNDYNTAGCYEYFNQLFQQMAKLCGIVLAVLFVTEIVALFFTVIMLVTIAANRKFGVV